MTYYIDASFFLKFFLGDSREQNEEVRQLFSKGASGEEKLVSSSLSFLEAYKVLKSLGRFSKNQIAEALEAILQMDFINFKRKEIIFRAMEIYSNKNLSLNDCFHQAYLLESDKDGEAIKLATFYHL